MFRLATPLILAIAPACAADALFESAQRKLDSITRERTKPGSAVVFAPAEANAWARIKLAAIVPRGIRNLHLDFSAGMVTAQALADFQKIRQAEGLLARMLEGERPVKVIARVVSANGSATVYLTRVEISQAAASGALLDFLISTFVRPLYPEVKINEPIELDHRIDRIEIHPAGIRVQM